MMLGVWVLAGGRQGALSCDVMVSGFCGLVVGGFGFPLVFGFYGFFSFLFFPVLLSFLFTS
jgi:hypothetical protein